MKNAHILVIDTSDTEDKQFNEPLIELISRLADCTVVNHADIDPRGDFAKLYDGVIVSGVPLHYDFETLDDRLNRLEWIRTTDLPVAGICLGHQILGTLFGASLIRDKEAELGACALERAYDDGLFKNIPMNVEVETLHRGSITVPQDFTLLASSDKCVNVISRHKTKDIYGFQFHPERSPAGHTFLGNFIDIAATRRTVATA